jgi:hypothetical protein
MKYSAHNGSRFTGMGLFFAILLLVLGTFFRFFRADLAPETLPNFSPLMAAALCGAVFLPGLIGLILPMAALLLSDALLNAHYGVPILSVQLLWTLPCYLVAVGIGWMIRERRAGLWPIMGGTLLSSCFFYLVTNTGCWLGFAAYPQTLAGWVQALTVGLPGYEPTWMFFRNSLLGDVLFAALFVAVERSIQSRRVTLPA